MALEESVVYRITAKKSGQALALVADTTASSGYKVGLKAQPQNELQGWMFAKTTDNSYRIYPYIASNVSLTSSDQRAILDSKKGSQNQDWEPVLQADGVYYQFLVNQDAGNRNKLVDFGSEAATQYYKDTQQDQWKIEPLVLPFIPALTGGEGVNLTMGPTDHTTYIQPNETKKTVMVFIDFPDTKKRRAEQKRTALDTDSAKKMGEHLLGDESQANKIFKTQSNNNFALDVTDKSDLGWKLLEKDSSAYIYNTTQIDVTGLLADVKALFKEDVTFTDYAMTFVVQPKEADEITPGTAYGYSPSYMTLDAVIFGADSYRNRYVNLAHEVGHQIGLPDLYPYGDNGSKLSADFIKANVVHPVGCWSIMADMQHSESFLGWERHKMGWLDATRELYLPDLSTNPLRVTLNPLTDTAGLAMLVIPLGTAPNLSRVFVIEIGQDVYGVKKDADGKLVRDDTVSDKKGVLLYTVDAKVSSGEFPVKLIPKTISKSDQYGELFEAAYANGDTGTYKDDATNVELKVSVSKNTDSTYTVTLTKKATAT